MSPSVSIDSRAVPGVWQSLQCHGAGSSCQWCQQPWTGTVLGCTRICHQPVISGVSDTLPIPVLPRPSTTCMCTHRVAR